ncbi:MAG: molybdopterin converting factor subunit 1 [Alphaproteobacteria bacterium]|nr:molybdopterin converting factor subunit 1 [Alphaproteobacteria bacterium]
MKLLYFAWVRQKTGRGEETVPLPAGCSNLRDLASRLAVRSAGYADAFGDLRRLRAAINQEHADWDALIGEDDEIAFFPPVTGG